MYSQRPNTSNNYEGNHRNHEASDERLVELPQSSISPQGTQDAKDANLAKRGNAPWAVDRTKMRKTMGKK